MKVTYYVALQHYDFEGICGAKFTFPDHAEFLPQTGTMIPLTEGLSLKVSESWWDPRLNTGDVVMSGSEYFDCRGNPDENTSAIFTEDMRALKAEGWTLLTEPPKKLMLIKKPE